MHAQSMNTCMQLRAENKPSYLSQTKSDFHETFSVCQDWFLELINNIYWRVHVCMQAQCMKTFMQLEAKKSSYLCQKRSDLHKTFMVCQHRSPVSIDIVHGGAHCGEMKKMKVAQEGPMCTHNNFHTS